MVVVDGIVVVVVVVVVVMVAEVVVSLGVSTILISFFVSFCFGASDGCVVEVEVEVVVDEAAVAAVAVLVESWVRVGFASFTLPLSSSLDLRRPSMTDPIEGPF